MKNLIKVGIRLSPCLTLRMTENYLSSHKFYINNTPMKNCRNYVYLGVTFSISGSFTEAKTMLYHEGLKALFKVRKCFQGHSPKIQCWWKLKIWFYKYLSEDPIHHSNVIILLNYFETLAGYLTTTPNHQHKVDNEVSLSEGSQGYIYHHNC
jgi:hypothetical protein